MTESLITIAGNGIVRYSAIWYILESLMMPVGHRQGKRIRLARWQLIWITECLLTTAEYAAAESEEWQLFIELLFIVLPQVFVILCFADRSYQAPVIRKINVFIILYIIVGGLADLFSRYYVFQYLSGINTAWWTNAACQSLKSAFILLILFIWTLWRRRTQDRSLLNAGLFLLHFLGLLFFSFLDFSLNCLVYLLLSFLVTILLGRMEKLSLIRQLEEQKEQMRLQKQRIQMIKKNNQKQAWLRHDLRNLLTSVQILVDQGEKQKALDLLDQMELQWKEIQHAMRESELSRTASSKGHCRQPGG